MRIVLLLLSAVFLIVSFIFIQTKKQEPINISFYHWENSYNQKEIKQKVYIKVLDIS